MIVIGFTSITLNGLDLYQLVVQLSLQMVNSICSHQWLVKVDVLSCREGQWHIAKFLIRVVLVSSLQRFHSLVRV